MRGVAQVPERIAWAVGQLAVRPDDRLLEIGCASGHAIALVCPKLRRGSITAIDRSPTQVARARARNRACVLAGRACIEHVSLAEAPALLGRPPFAKAFAVNVNAFWTEPGPSLSSLSWLLPPGGLVCLVYDPPSDVRLRELRTRLPPLLHANGFRTEAVRVAAIGRTRALCVMGRRGASHD